LLLVSGSTNSAVCGGRRQDWVVAGL